MRTVIPILFLAVVGATLPASAALAAHVPGDYPTIQAAIDAGAKQVVVAPGVYPETLVVAHDVELRAEHPSAGIDPALRPVVYGLQIREGRYVDRVTVRGFHFTGPVTQTDDTGASAVAIVLCRLDGGYAGGGIGLSDSLGIDSCHIVGDLDAGSCTTVITDNTMVGGGIRAYSSGGMGISIQRNLILNSPDWAIFLSGCCTGNVITHNTIRGARNGIAPAEHGWLEHNLVEDCAGTAYCLGRGGVARDNVARRCGGDGIEFAGYYGQMEAVGNVVDSVGLCGLHLAVSFWGNVRDNVVRHSGSHGIWSEGGNVLSGNRVLHAGGDGIRSSGPANQNVVGRCAGAGIVAADASHNTSYLNQGAGFALTGGIVTHNIAYGNGGPGLEWSGSEEPGLGCNDWFDNAGGTVVGTGPGGTDVSVDPAFCAVAEDDVHLRDDSPLVDLEGCGLVGALGPGCVAVVPMRFSLYPGVLDLRSKGRWVAGCLQPPAPYAAGDIEVNSIRVNGTVPVDTRGPVTLADRDGDGVPDLEVKFDRDALERTVAGEGAVVVTVEGTISARPFRGTASIRVQGAPRAAGSE